MDVAITKMSTKGQIVIPAEMRDGFEVGDKLLLIKSGDSVIIKKANKLQKQFLEDMELARRTEEAWQKYDRGEFKKMKADEFLKELKKC
jgi:AbrB family looped-hinge helix DNA binding protein